MVAARASLFANTDLPTCVLYSLHGHDRERCPHSTTTNARRTTQHHRGPAQHIPTRAQVNAAAPKTLRRSDTCCHPGNQRTRHGGRLTPLATRPRGL